MFRPMRRIKQILTEAECKEILTEQTHGVLAVAGDDDYPYAVPLSYAYSEKQNAIYFHGAKSGHKIEAMMKHDKVSFCVVAQDEILPEKYSTNYKSVIVFGKIKILDDEAQIIAAAEILGRKYAPNNDEAHLHEEIHHALKAMYIMELSIEQMTGKQGKYLLPK